MKSNKNIIVFGCKSTSQFLIEFLIQLGDLKCIITIDETTAKNNEVADYLDLNPFALANNIQIYHAKSYNLNNFEDQEFCKKLNIDIAFVMGWQRLIPKSILDLITIGSFGMHGSSMNLPFGRGRSPMNWAIIEGRKVFYTNLFKYDSGVDSGDILSTYKFSINDKDTAETMHFKNLLAMRFLIKENYNHLKNNSLTFKKQLNLNPTYYPKRNPEDSIINWEDDICNIDRFIRSVSPPFNGAFTFCNGFKIIIYEAQIFDLVEFGYENEKNGSVLEIFPNGKFLIKGIGGLILVNNYKCDLQIRKGDILNNNGLEIKKFTINSLRGFDLTS